MLLACLTVGESVNYGLLFLGIFLLTEVQVFLCHCWCIAGSGIRISSFILLMP
jgi:hypothetical protein